MPKDITVHFVGNARDLAAASATAEASVDRFGNATVKAGAEAEAASVGFDSLLAPLIAIGAAAVVATAPIAGLAGTFALLGGGVVGLAFFTGNATGAFALFTERVKDAANALGVQAAPMAAILLSWLGQLIPVVQMLGTQLLEWLGQRLPTMLPIVTQILQVTIGAVVGLAQAWGHLVDWFMANWPTYSASLKSLFDQIGTGITYVTPLLGLLGATFEALGPVIQFVRDHADSLKPILYAVGGLLVFMAFSAGMTVVSLLLLVAGIEAISASMSFAISHINAVADAFWAVVHAVEAAISAIGRVRDAIASVPVVGGFLHGVVPGFQEGGVVPGLLGAPMLAMVHGGETVTPPGRGGGGNTNHYTINVSAAATSPADVGRQVVAAIQEYERRSGTAWRS